ncbi:MAG: glycine zipper family protein [Acetobacter sp.]|uniref:glycine zipper family protein n=1 Tax=Acetobacter sp. TaxID=440 RepID=UPI0039E8FC94
MPSLRTDTDGLNVIAKHGIKRPEKRRSWHWHGGASGALLGSVTGNAGHGAAIGAGSGLLLGSIIGVGRAKQASQTLQHRYDGAYAQCMVGHGERLPLLPMAYGTPPVVAYPPPIVIYLLLVSP